MKRTISILISLVMILTSASFAFASDNSSMKTESISSSNAFAMGLVNGTIPVRNDDPGADITAMVMGNDNAQLNATSATQDEVTSEILLTDVRKLSADNGIGTYQVTAIALTKYDESDEAGILVSLSLTYERGTYGGIVCYKVNNAVATYVQKIQSDMTCRQLQVKYKGYSAHTWPGDLMDGETKYGPNKTATAMTPGTTSSVTPSKVLFYNVEAALNFVGASVLYTPGRLNGGALAQTGFVVAFGDDIYRQIQHIKEGIMSERLSWI